MTVGTLTLTDFLLARIADTERAWGVSEFRARLDPLGDGSMSMADRVLADCEAKRQIVEMHAWESDLDDGVTPPLEFNTDCFECRQAPPCNTLRTFALPYSDHPDYRPEWRP